MTATITPLRRHQRPELDRIVYLTGVITDSTQTAHRPDLGMLTTPASCIQNQSVNYQVWGADNGLYHENHPTKGFTFNDEKWLAWVARLPHEGNVFVALPDVLHWFEDGEDAKGNTKYFCVGDYEATIARSAKYVDAVHALGYPVAIVAQDGLAHLDQIPFDVDAVFIGGSDAYKLGPVAAGLIAEARAAGLWTHMGRVNSYKRLSYAHSIGTDSADGTYLRFGKKDQNFPKLIEWLDRLAEIPRPDPTTLTMEEAA